MQTKEKFEKPEMEVVEFDSEDVIVTSTCASDHYCVVDCQPNCSNVF